MTRAHDTGAFELSRIERRAIVGADVFDGIERSIDIAKEHFDLVDRRAPRGTDRDAGSSRYAMLAHALCPYFMARL